MENYTEKSEVYEVDCSQLYQTIIDYQNYPKFVDGVDEIEVLHQDEQGARVRYSLEVVKRFSYTLLLKHVPKESVSWELESGDLFKVNKGSWKLKDLGNGKTHVTYGIALDFNLMVPKMILTKLIGSNLPNMMTAMVEEAKKRNKEASLGTRLRG